MGKNVQVIILCGGLGTRLREETEFRPKPMVNIGTKPILWHIMKIYGVQGFKNFILTLGYKGEVIKNYFYHYEIMNNDVTIELGIRNKLHIHSGHEENDWTVTLADTGEKAFKGSRLKKVERYIIGDTFMVTYGDGVADINLQALLAFHQSHGKMVTLTGINPSSQFGELKVVGQQVVSFDEKPSDGGSLVNGGFFVFNRRIFDYLTVEDQCDLEHGTLEQIAREGQLMVYQHKGFWACMDTLRDTEKLNKLWQENRAPWKIW
jgi:glucose-1-phosphate cytidylyltransferase